MPRASRRRETGSHFSGSCSSDLAPGHAPGYHCDAVLDPVSDSNWEAVMATRRKAKAKTKRKATKVAKEAARGKSPAAKKPAAKKRPAKKAPVKRTSAKKRSPAARVAVKPTPPSAPIQSVATAAPPAPAQAASREERIGVVTHYFGHLSVAIVRLESGRLHLGDVIRIRGHTTDFTQRVESLEVNHAPTTDVGPNDDFGLKVVDHAREHDVVYKVV